MYVFYLQFRNAVARKWPKAGDGYVYIPYIWEKKYCK